MAPRRQADGCCTTKRSNRPGAGMINKSERKFWSLTMAKPEWGGKHTCSHCSAVFYDMQQSPIVCPACGKTHEPESPLKARRGSRASAEAAKKAAVKPAAKPEVVKEVDDDVEETDEAFVELDDDDDALIEDDDLDEGEDIPAVGKKASDSDDKDT
jgi:uncharacterized protein (TIGR02300 family)